MRCVLCGKEYKRQVTDTHLKSHGVNREEYDQQASTFSENAWEFYWSHPGLRVKFPDPLATEPPEGKKSTFRKWLALPKVKKGRHELQGEL